MSIRVVHSLGELERDLRQIPVVAAREIPKIVRRRAVAGNRRAKAFAKKSAGRHGKHYHKAFSVEALSASSWTYGPEADMPQGDMSFEHGSRNQKPHLDLAKSADLDGPELAADVRDLLDKLFWL